MHPLALGLIAAPTPIREEIEDVLRDQPARIVLRQSEAGDSTFLSRLDQLRPDAVLVYMPALPGQAEALFQQIKSSAAEPVVIALHLSPDADAILRAMRAGADEYLYPPFAQCLPEALERISARRAQRRSEPGLGARILVFLSAKGGCGATTVACHAALDLQRRGASKIILADFDFRGGIISFLMKTHSRFSVAHALENVHRLDASYWKALVSNGLPGLEILAAPPLALSPPPPDPGRLRSVLAFARGFYEWILADLGSGLSLAASTALEEADDAFLVVTLDVPALHQAKEIVRMLLAGGYKKDRLHLIVNRVPRNPEATAAELEKMLNHPVYAMLPDDYATLYDSYAEGKMAPPGSNLGEHVSRVVRKIAGIEEQPKRGFFDFRRKVRAHGDSA